MSVSFLGLNSSINSASLVDQLISIETQSKIKPLDTKKQTLSTESSFLSTIRSNVTSLQSTLKIKDIGNGNVELLSKKVTSSDTSNAYVAVTATDKATTQSFNLSVTKLATNTIKKSASSVSTAVTGASTIDNIALKGGATLSNGTVTINGTTQTLNVNTGTNTVNDLLTFFNSYAGVTATLNGSGHIQLSGVTSLGGAGDTSNLLSSLGLDNSTIVATVATGLQNIDAPKQSATLSSLGINGTNITINGSSITFDPATDTVKTLVNKINDNASAKVDASYDAINGQLLLTNKNTGALSLTTSSTDSNVLTKLNLTSETLGDNAEFSISTLNGGSTLVSNSNTVTGLIEGVTLDLKQVTASAVKVSIADDKDAYVTKIKSALDQVNSLVKALNKNGKSFARNFSNKLKDALTTFETGATDTYRSMVEIGLKSTLDGDGKFSGFTLDETKFKAALTNSISSVNTALYGKTGTSVSALSDGSSGILVQLNDLLNTYVNPDVPASSIIGQVSDSISAQIKDIDKTKEKRQASIDAYQKRLKAQFSQLDTLNAQMQRQQAAVSSLTAKANG